MHSAVSDGTDTPDELLPKVKEAGIDVFSLTDHDGIKGCREIMRNRRDGDPAFVCGVEFSCRNEYGKYHILGYHYDPDALPVNRLVEKTHSFRMKKTVDRLDFLREEFGFDFSADDRERLLSLDNPGKPHIANLMVRYGYAPNKDVAISEYINKKRFADGYISPEEAIGVIVASGGIPVLAHPFFGDGDQLILGDDMQSRLVRLMECGLRGVEAFYSGFSPKMTAEMLEYAARFGLYVTAGSDYHGENKLVHLGDTGIKKCDFLPEGTIAFLRAIGVY